MGADAWGLGHLIRDAALSASLLLICAGIVWRLALRPTVKAILELRAEGAGREGVLERRLLELEQEVRQLKAQLPEAARGLELPLPPGELVRRTTRIP